MTWSLSISGPDILVTNIWSVSVGGPKIADFVIKSVLWFCSLFLWLSGSPYCLNFSSLARRSAIQFSFLLICWISTAMPRIFLWIFFRSCWLATSSPFRLSQVPSVVCVPVLMWPNIDSIDGVLRVRQYKDIHFTHVSCFTDSAVNGTQFCRLTCWRTRRILPRVVTRRTT